MTGIFLSFADRIILVSFEPKLMAYEFETIKA